MTILHSSLGKTEEEIAEAEEKFQKVAEAYEVLSSTELRRKYDNGEEASNNNTYKALNRAARWPHHCLLMCYTPVIDDTHINSNLLIFY